MDSSARAEGMVAIITGLRDAGLSVTVSDARQLGSRSRRSSVGHAASQSRMRTLSSGVQTCRPPERSLSNTQFQNLQRTTYQSAYNAPMTSSRPASPQASASPPRGVTASLEFQHLERQLSELRACLLANGQGIPSASHPRAMSSPVRTPSAPIRHPSPSDMPTRQLGMVPVRDVTHRSSVNLHRGSSKSSPTPSYRRDKASNDFVESLRKYPNSSLAERTISVDIIQRLMAQSKSGSKRTTHLKRVRSLTRHSHESSSKRPPNTKTSRKNESPTREVIASVYGTERKKRVLRLEGSAGYPNGRGTVSFECLTNSFAHAHRSTDVRYLSDVTRYVRDTLRQIGNNEDGVCPHMLNRYSAHRREYHQTEAGTLTIDDPIAQASSSKRPKRVCRFNETQSSLNCKGESSNLSDSVRMKMFDIKQRLCLICNQPEPCRCGLPPPCPCPDNRPTSLKDRLKSLDLCEELRRLCNQEPLYEACSCPQNVDELIDEMVDNWLINIPIYAGYTYKEKLTRDDIVNTLRKSLKEDVGQQLKCEKDIFTCLKNLPMWLPPDTTDHKKFKENLGKDLLTTIVSIDLFGNKVRQWVEVLPFLPDVTVDIDKIATDLSRKLKDVAMTTKNLRNDLTECTYEVLDNLPIRECSCMEKEDLAERLTDLLVSLPQEVIDNLIHMDDFSSVRKKVELLEKIKRWVNGIPIDTSEIIDRDKIATDLTEQLDTIVENTEPGELWEAVKRTARRKLDGLKIQGGHTEVEIQASKLADILIPDLFSAIVDKWAKSVAFDHNANIVIEVFAHDLTKKLLLSIAKADPEESEELMKNIISDMLNSVPASGSLSLKVAQAAKLANALSKLGSKETSELKETIKRWIEEVPFESESDTDKKRIVNNLAKKVKNTVDTKTPYEIWPAVKNDALKEIGNIRVTCTALKLEKHAEQLADDVIAFLLHELVNSWVKGLPFKQGGDSYANDFAAKVNDLVKDNALLEDKGIDFLKGKINEELPDELLECDTAEKAKLIEGFLESVKKGPKSRDKITMVVENWLKHKVPLTSPLSTEKVNGIAKRIKNKLAVTNPREQWNVVKSVAIEELESFPIDCLPSEIEALAEDLASNLASDDFQEIVKQWAKNIHFEPYSEELVEQFTIDLTNKLKQAMGTDYIEDARDAMKPIIVNELGELPTLYDAETKDTEAETLLNSLAKLKTAQDKILVQVEKWFRTVPFLPEPSVNKVKITKRLTNNLKTKLQSMNPETTWHELKAVTRNELAGLPINGGRLKTEKLAENLANLLVSDMLLEAIRNWTKKVPFDTHKVVNKNDVVNELAKKVHKIIDATDPQNQTEKLTEGIFNTLENLPVVCTKSQKTSLAEDLANIISNIPKEQDLFSQTLHDWLQTFPFDPKETVDKGKLATNMETKLKRTIENETPEKTRDAMQSDINDSLQTYKMKCSDTEKEKLADALADKLVSDIFSDTVRKWVNTIPLRPTPVIDTNEVIQKITDKLRPKFALIKPDKDGILNTIRGELAKIPVDRNPITKDAYLTQIANELYDKLLKCPPEETEERKSKKRPVPTFAINVNEMLKGVTVSLAAEDNEKLVKKTLDKLRTLRSEGRDEAFIRKEIKRDIEVGVDEMLAGKKTDPQARKNLAKKLYTQVFDTFKNIGAERKNELIPKFMKSIKDWLAAHSELAMPKNKQEKFIKDLADKLANEAVGVGTQTDIKKKMMKIIGITLDTINSTIKNDSNLKNMLTQTLIQNISANIGLPTPEAGKKNKKETVYHVADIQKRENETQADEIIPKKRMRSLALGFSDDYGNRLNTSEGDQKLIMKDKSALVGDLLHSFEKSAELPENFYENGTRISERVLRKTRKWIEIIPEIPSSELSTQMESGKISIPNEGLNRHKENKRIKEPYIDIKTKLILTDKMTEQLSNCSSSSYVNIITNISKDIKKCEEERTAFPTSSDETLTENKVSEKVAHNLTNKLTSLQFQGLNNNQIKEEMVSNVEYELENILNTDDIKKNKLADKLLVKLLKTIGSASPTSTNKTRKNKRPSFYDILQAEYLENAIKRDVKEWLNEIAEVSSKSFTKGITNLNNIRGLTVNIAEYKEKQEVSENKNSIEACNLQGNNLSARTKNLGTIIDTIESTISSTTYSMSTSDDDSVNNLEIIKKDVTDWTKGILKLCNSNPVEIENMIMALTEKLSKVNTLDLNKKEIRKKLRQDIVDKLNYHFKFKGEPMDIETKQILANQLIDKITKSDRAVSCQKHSDTVNGQMKRVYSPRNTRYKINQWIGHIPELSHSNHAEKKQKIKRLSRALAKKISRIREQDLDKEEARRQMLNTISDKLDIALKIMDKQIDSKIKQRLLNELLYNLTESTPYYSFNSAYKHELLKNIKKQVEEWMKDIFGISADALKNRKLAAKIIENLVEIIMNSQTIRDKEVNNNILEKIIEELENVYDSKGNSIGTLAKYKLAHKLLDKVVKTSDNLQTDFSLKYGNNKRTISDENFNKSINEIDDLKTKMMTGCLKNETFTNSSARKITSPFVFSYRKFSDLVENNPCELEDAFRKDVTDWIEEFSELRGSTTGHKRENKIIATDLSKALALLEIKKKDDLYVQKQMQKEIKKQVGKIFYYRGNYLDKNTKNKLVNELLQKIICTLNNVESLRAKTNSSENIQEVINARIKTEKFNFNLLTRHIFYDYLSNWFDKVPELQANNINEKIKFNKIFRELARSLADLQFQNLDISDLRNKMAMIIRRNLNIISIYKSVCLNSKTIDDLTSHLIDQITESNENPSELATSSVNNANSGISALSKKNIRHIFSSLGDQNLNAGEKKYDKKVDGFTKFKIKDHLGGTLEKNNLKEVTDYANKSTNTTTNFESKVFQDNIIWEWVYDNPQLSKEREKLEDWNTPLYKAKNYFVGDDIHNQSVKKTWINRTSKVKNKNMPLKIRLPEDIQSSIINLRTNNDNLSRRNSLFPEVNRKYTSIRRSVGHFTSSPSKVFYVEESSGSSVKEISREIDADTQAKIFSLILNNIDCMDEQEDRAILKRQIVNILVKDAQLPENEAMDLAESILKSAEEQAASANSDEKQLLTILRKEIRKIMADFPIDQEHMEAIEAFLMDLEVKRLFEGVTYDDDEEMKAAILKLMKEKGGLSDEDAVAVLGKLGGNYEMLLASPTVQKSLMRIKTNKPNNNNLSLEEILSFETKAKQILGDFFDTYVDYPSPEKQNKIDAVVNETVSNLGDILDVSENEPKDEMRDELNKQIRRISLDTAESVMDLVEDVLEDIVEAYKNSKSAKKWHPNNEILSERLEKYTNKIEKVIENWLDDLPLSTDDLDDEQFKDTMIKDLAGDIIDRETYLQTHPEVSTSESKERDHLKKICHIWMNKFLEDDDLKMAMTGTDDLIDAIRGVPVPKLIADKKLTADKESYFDALQDEILKWAESLPPNIKPTVDDDTMKKHVNDLAKTIQSLKGKPGAEEKIRSAIKKALPLIYGDLDEDELEELETSLFDTLMNKGFTDDTWRPGSSGAKPTYRDALQKEMVQWAKGLPPHIKPIVDDDTMRKHLNDLAKTIESLKGQPDAEEKIRAAIKKALPLIFGDLDEADMKILESSLFNTLMNKGFTDDTWVPELSMGDKPTYVGALQKEILGWVKGLPPNIKPTVDDDTMRKHVNDLAKTIENLKGKPGAEEKIRSAIKKTLPLIFENLDDDELQELESSLFDTLMNKGFTDDTWRPGHSSAKPTYRDALQKEMVQWAKGLPPHIKPIVDDDTMRKHLNDLAKTIESLKGQPDAEEKIRAAIKKALPLIFGDLDEADMKKLESSLFKTLMNKGFTDDTWVPELSMGDKPTYGGALQKEILGWVKGLPPNIKPTVDDDTLRKHVKDLAKTIENLKGKPGAEGKIRSAIKKTLPLIFEDLDDSELKELESSLFDTLMNKGFTDDTWKPSLSGGKPTYMDALQKEIANWAKRLPPNIKPTVDDATMRKHINDLAKTIQSLKGKPDAEEKIRAAIKKTLPLIYGDLDEAELKKLESSLFNTLMKKGFTDDTWVPELSMGDKPTYGGALQKEILSWVKSLPPNIKPTVDDNTLRKHVSDLAKTIENLKGRPDAEVKIRSAIGRTLPQIFGDLDDAELKRLESLLFNRLMNKGFTDDTWVPEEVSDYVEENMIKDVLGWLKQSPMYQKASPEERKKMELAAIEMAKGLNNTFANLKPGSDAEKMLHDEIKRHLKNILADPEGKYDEKFWDNAADNVLNYLKASPTFQGLTGLVGPDDLLGLAVDDWVNSLPIEVRSPQELACLNDAKRNLKSRLTQARAQFPPSSPQHEQAIRDEARKFLRSNLTDPQKRADERYIDEMANKLVKLLNMVPVAHSDSVSTIKPYKSPADTLYEYIGDWVNNLPVEGDTEKVNLMKQNLATKLINKIGELNMNPDIFNDTDLYEYSLSDEIDKLLEELPRNPELDKYLPALKKELIYKIMDARQKILDELAGKVYKQQLRDKVSASLPLPSCLTVDEQASLEMIKDKLADAFIDLHFANCEGYELTNYKTKISNELNRFCADIFRHYPCARIDVEKVKDDLHRALMKVPVPRDDSMKSEVEQVRIRDIVNDWMREIPLRQETASDKLRRYKLAVVLAKHIHDIEMEKQHNDFIDSEHRIREEIRKFMNMIPIREDREFLVPELVQTLINRLQCSEQSRRFFSFERCQTSDTREYSSLCSQHPLSSTLCPRNQTIEKPSQPCKDSLLCTPLMDSCSQTYQGVHQTISRRSCNVMPRKKEASCMTQRESPSHISPRILVKEYIWDSPETCTGAHDYTPPCLKRSFSQGVQVCPPQIDTGRKLASTSSGMEQQSSPYKGISSSPASQHPSMYDPSTPEFSPPLDAQRSSYSPYNSYSGFPRQSNPCPTQSSVINDRPKSSDCYCPPFQETEIPFKQTQSYSTEDHSDEEWPCAGPSRYCRRPYPSWGEDKAVSCGRRRRSVHRRPERCDNEDFWNACWRHRGRPMAGYRSDKIKDKCDCKDRFWVSYKGRRDRFMDMCQACGTSCPHPSTFLFSQER